MPLSQPVRYRTVTRGGKKIRLAFVRGTNRVIEAKNLRTGATHTEAEFRRDRARHRGVGGRRRV